MSKLTELIVPLLVIDSLIVRFLMFGSRLLGFLVGDSNRL